MENRDIIVIGASAGGLDAIATLLAQIPADIAAAFLVAVHVPAEGRSAHVRILGRSTPLLVREARDGDRIERGNVYVAPNDRHLIVAPGGVRVARGPKENRSRPAIDPLFRSAADAYGERVTGILLTGYLDDGVAGLAAIHRAGGLTIVQDPGDAEFPDMPSAALARVRVDHCAPVFRMGALVMHAVTGGVMPTRTAESHAGVETRIAAGEDVDMVEQEHIGEPAGLGCPDCGGPLVRVHDPDVRRYRCHIGHAYTARALLAGQSEQVERALSAAMRTLEERARVLSDLAADPSSGTDDTLRRRAAEARSHAETLRSLVLAGPQAPAA